MLLEDLQIVVFLKIGPLPSQERNMIIALHQRLDLLRRFPEVRACFSWGVEGLSPAASRVHSMVTLQQL